MRWTNPKQFYICPLLGEVIQSVKLIVWTFFSFLVTVIAIPPGEELGVSKFGLTTQKCNQDFSDWLSLGHLSCILIGYKSTGWLMRHYIWPLPVFLGVGLSLFNKTPLSSAYICICLALQGKHTNANWLRIATLKLSRMPGWNQIGDEFRQFSFLKDVNRKTEALVLPEYFYMKGSCQCKYICISIYHETWRAM